MPEKNACVNSVVVKHLVLKGLEQINIAKQRSKQKVETGFVANSLQINPHVRGVKNTF